MDKRYKEKKGIVSDTLAEGFMQMERLIKEQPKFNQWIPCVEGMPKEHDSIFSKYKCTDKWYNGMFEKRSDTVIVTVEYDNGSRTTMKSHTVDGKWKLDTSVKCSVIAWMSLPEPYKGDE